MSKSDIHSHLWPAVFVTDEALKMLVNEVRRAIGDSPGEAEFVRMVRGIGYAFAGISATASTELDVAPMLQCWLTWEGVCPSGDWREHQRP